jgi:hypothetical protein
MATRKASRMFRVIVVAGVSLAACGGNEEISNPPPPPRDGAAPPADDAAVDAGFVPADAAVDAPADARDEQMPAIK